MWLKGFGRPFDEKIKLKNTYKKTIRTWLEKQ